MRCGVQRLAVVAVVVAACGPDPAVFASSQPASLPGEPAEVGAPAAPELRSIAVAMAPQSPSEFVQRLNSHVGAAELTLTAENFVSLFTPRRGDVDDPGVGHAFADLDGDGQDEAVAVLDGGWWGRSFAVCAFRADARGWVLADHLRVEGAVRGTAVGQVHKLGARTWVAVGHGDGWGTGYQSAACRLFELCSGRLVEVLRYRGRLEEIYGGHGPVLTVLAKPLEIGAQPACSALSARLQSIVEFDGVEFAGLPSRAQAMVHQQWLQPAPGMPFVPTADSVKWERCEELWRAGARAWLQDHATAVRPRIATADVAQISVLRRTCELALEGDTFPLAQDVLQLLPSR